MTPNEIDAGLNGLMGSGTSVATVFFAMYFWRNLRRWWVAVPGTVEADEAARVTFMAGAILLSMVGAASMSGMLTIYYFARAAGDLETLQWARGVIPYANVAKGVAGVAALLHIRGILEGGFGKMWLFVVAAIAATAFAFFGLTPRLM